MTEKVRQITDSPTLAALAHPLRRRLMDMLKVYGPATASSLAERTDQAVANVSHHLRVLGTAGIIEEAPELARDKRERWWRMATGNMRWSSADFSGDPAATLVADAAKRAMFEQHVRLTQEWFSHEPGMWADQSYMADKWLQLTPSELGELAEEVIAIFSKWASREVPDDGQDREPVLVFSYGMPAKP